MQCKSNHVRVVFHCFVCKSCPAIRFTHERENEIPPFHSQRTITCMPPYTSLTVQRIINIMIDSYSFLRFPHPLFSTPPLGIFGIICITLSKNHRWNIKKPITILYWVLDGTNIGPYSPPHPHPQRQQKSPARGQTKLKKVLF